MGNTFRKYGLEWPEGTSNYAIEKHCYMKNLPREKGGLGKAGHLRQAIIEAYGGAFKYNSLADQMVRDICSNRLYAVISAGGMGKSTTMAAIGVVLWDCAPEFTTVTLYTSSLEKQNMRAFGAMVKFFSVLKERFPDVPGRYIDSKYQIVYDPPPGKTKNKSGGIFAFGISQAEDRKKVNAQSGVHNTYNIRIIDEHNACDPVVNSGLANMLIQGDVNHVFSLANPDNWDNHHGRLLVPEGGIESVDEKTGSWMSKRGFFVRHFSAFDSPAIKDPDGEKTFKGIFPNRRNIEDLRKIFGENSIEWYQQVIGFFPLSGVTFDTVLTRPMVEQFDILGNVSSRRQVAKLGSIDPASTGTGDAKILTLASLIEDYAGRMVCCIDRQIDLKIKTDDRTMFTSLLAKEALTKCLDHGVSKDHLAIDCSGTDGLADTLDMMWNADGRVHRVFFTGKPSRRRVSIEDGRQAVEVYDRRVTELWMMVRQFVMGRQLMYIPEPALQQFFTRKVILKYNKQSVQRKKEMDGQSPNEADSIVCMVDMLREVFRIDPATPKIAHKDSQSEYDFFMNNFRNPLDIDEKDLLYDLENENLYKDTW